MTDNTNNLGDYKIILLERSTIHQELFDTWLTDLPTKFVSTPADFSAEFDSTVAAVSLPQSLLKEEREEIKNYVLTRNPFCQLVLLSYRSPQSLVKDGYDVILQRPVSKTELRSTVKNRLIYGVYSLLLHEFYNLNMSITSVGESDSEADSVSRQCINRLLEIEPQLKQLQSGLSEEDIREVSRTIYRHKGYLNEPSTDVDRVQTSKHHPDECPTCNLPWGHDYENELGMGFTSLGAGVWKCNRCDEIIHGVSGSQQRVV